MKFLTALKKLQDGKTNGIKRMDGYHWLVLHLVLKEYLYLENENPNRAKQECFAMKVEDYFANDWIIRKTS